MKFLNNLPDWLIRALKTFVQAFFGVLIPSFASYIADGFPEDWNTLWMWLLPVICASLSAAISAVWNFLIEYHNSKIELPVEDDEPSEDDEPFEDDVPVGGGGTNSVNVKELQ